MSLKQCILVTGGAGYIGSHTCVELLNAGYDVVVYDNFSNSHPESLKRVERITGKKIHLVKGDIRDQALLESTLRQYACIAVMHFAGFKAVGESVEKPLQYYDNNVVGSIRLLEAMKNVGLKTIIFSSSATVYGEPQYLPIDESHPLSATNPYGRSKLFIEEILRDQYRADNEWKITILRYFNPIGAHESGLIGEDSNHIPNNLMPYIAQVAIGKLPYLNIFGSDYSTQDGTGVRDYVHVVDLAKGHLSALHELNSRQCISINLGTGVGYSVLDIVRAFERVSSRSIHYKIVPRRSGDVAVCYANAKLAKQLLGWQARYSIEKMCLDNWIWQKKSVSGFS